MSKRITYRFRLYIAGDALNSAHAVANLAALCRAHLADRHEIEIVDVFREPKRALADGIFMTPTLVKLAPFPARRVVGTLSQTETVLHVLGLETVAAVSLETQQPPAAPRARDASASRYRGQLKRMAT